MEGSGWKQVELAEDPGVTHVRLMNWDGGGGEEGKRTNSELFMSSKQQILLIRLDAELSVRRCQGQLLDFWLT